MEERILRRKLKTKKKKTLRGISSEDCDVENVTENE